MRRVAVLSFILSFSVSALALNGIVTTRDGNRFEGNIQFHPGQLTVVTGATQSVVAVSNLALVQLVKPAPRRPPGSGNGLFGVYYDRTNFTGTAIVRIDESIDFDWQEQAPVLGAGRDQFSVRWTGRVEAPATDDYTFHIGTDDGGRLWIDEKLLLTDWNRHDYGETNATVRLVEGKQHQLRFEHFDVVGPARARLFWSSPSIPKTIVPLHRLYAESPDPEHRAEISSANGLLATYYNGNEFTGNSFSRVEPGVDAAWNGTLALPAIASNRFSVRWTGSLLVTNTETYTFHVDAAQPVRLFIDERLISDPWTAGAEQRQTVPMTPGRYDLCIETRCTNGSGRIKLMWSTTNSAAAPLPIAQLFPQRRRQSAPLRRPRPPLAPGVVLLDGTIVSAPVLSANNSSVRVGGRFTNSPIALAGIARIHARPLAPEMIEAVPQDRAGILLKNRDFIDGELASIEGGRVKISSVLFGNRTYDLARDVAVVALRQAPTNAVEFIVTARDGTSLHGKSLRFESDRVAVDAHTAYSIALPDVSEIAWIDAIRE